MQNPLDLIHHSLHYRCMYTHICFDIETASGMQNFDMLSIDLQQHRIHKCQSIKKYDQTHERATPAELYGLKAWIYAEFGRIVCISVWRLVYDDDIMCELQSFYGDDEHDILTQFCEYLWNQIWPIKLIWHNIKEFDMPYVCRRMIMHDISLPDCLQLQWKKPRDVPHCDTLELWKFGDLKNYISLALLAHLLGLPSPKDDINGADVSTVFWQWDVQRISTYCLKDVWTTAQVFLKLKHSKKNVYKLELT